jgi:hypothetical protein
MSAVWRALSANIAGFACPLAASLLLPAAIAAAQTRDRLARRSISVRDSAHLHLVRSSGNTRLSEGPASGTLPGTLRLQATVKGLAFTFGYSIAVRGGTITGHGSAKLHIGGGPYASFAGTGVADGGSGRYLHAEGSGRFYGSENRLSHSGSVQVVATMSY